MSDRDDEPARYERRGTGLEFDRVAFFSDAVYAIAMTLLVVGIGVPHVRDAALGKAISDRGAEISSFFIGFAILGFYWISHHALMAQLRAINTRFMACNLVYLSVIAFLPFPTAITGSNGGEPLAVIIFGAALAAVSILEVTLYLCAYRDDLMTERPDAFRHRHSILAGLLPAVIVLLSLPLAFIDTRLTMFAWILIFPGEQLLDRLVPSSAPDD